MTGAGLSSYVDTGQTGQTRAIVAPYSVRAVAGATVSTPLQWDEVTYRLDPRAFTLKTVPGRLAKHGDPMKKLLQTKANGCPKSTASDNVPSENCGRPDAGKTDAGDAG